jgi:NADPH:quinone reductase-like Zn-dependent oxidoreductase
MISMQWHEFGLENGELHRCDLARRSTGTVRVAMEKVALNYRDLLMVQGLYNPKIPMPLIPCSDGCGRVLEADDDCPFPPGSRVMTRMIPGWQQGGVPANAHQNTLGGPMPGCLRDLADLPEDALMAVPDPLDSAAAACVPVAALTAWRALKRARIGPGSRVLTLGSGGVSLFALQFAKALGAEVAITSSSAGKWQRLNSLGADLPLLASPQDPWDSQLLRLWPDGVDLVVELGGAGSFNRSVKVCRMGGSIALIGVLAEVQDPPNLLRVMMKDLTVHGLLVGPAEDQWECAQFMAERGIKPIIHRQFQGLAQAKEAFACMAEASHMGKIVIDLST